MLCCKKVDILLLRSMVCFWGELDDIVDYPLNLVCSVYDKMLVEE